MSIAPRKNFVNNEIPLIFNVDTFKTNTVNSDNLTGLSLIVDGQSDLNNVDVRGNLDTVAIVNTASIVSNTINSVGLLTASNGFTVSTGPVSFPANSIPVASVNGVNGRLTTCETNFTKLLNAVSNGNTIVNTITTNILTIDYTTNNNRPNLITPTANFSIVVTNVPTTSVNGYYRIELFISARFYCNAITVNGTVLTMTAVGGLVNLPSQINASATGLIQTFIIFFTGTTTPSRVITELKSTW